MNEFPKGKERLKQKDNISSHANDMRRVFTVVVQVHPYFRRGKNSFASSPICVEEEVIDKGQRQKFLKSPFQSQTSVTAEKNLV